MKLIVTGHARHGKDTVCDMLCKKLSLVFTSSSYFVGEKVVRPWLAERGIRYFTSEEMYADRINHRAEWFDAISDYCKDDGARLGRELFEAGNDVYCGLRNKRELDALREQGIVNMVIWVDASNRLPPEPEPESSMTITAADCDFVVSNNGTLPQLEDTINHLIQVIYHRMQISI